MLAGFFLFGGYAFQTFGLRLTSPAKSSFITGLSIPAVPLLAAIVYRRRVNERMEEHTRISDQGRKRVVISAVPLRLRAHSPGTRG